MIAIIRHTSVFSLFDHVFDGQEMRGISSPHEQIAGAWRVDEAPWGCSVFGFTGHDLIRTAHDPLGPMGLGWLCEMMREIASTGPYLPFTVDQAWSTYGGAHWARARFADGTWALVFYGRRGQWNAHTCGWEMPVCGATSVEVYTTLTDNAPTLPGLEGVPVNIVALPRPREWRAPGAVAAEVIPACSS